MLEAPTAYIDPSLEYETVVIVCIVSAFVYIDWVVGAVTFTVWKILYLFMFPVATIKLLLDRSKSKLGQAVKVLSLQSKVPDDKNTLIVPLLYPIAYLSSF